MMVEAHSVNQALKCCIRMGLNMIILETDSLSLTNMIEGKWKVSWEITNVIEEIQDNLTNKQIQVRHTFREKSSC